MSYADLDTEPVNEYGDDRRGSKVKVVSLNLMIVGYARHGKDTVAELLRDDYGFHFVSSSYFMAERVILPKMLEAWDRWEDPERGRNVAQPAWPRYADLDECYEDRVNHRQFWFDTIAEANEEDPAYLSTEIFKEHDLYVGNRNPREFHASKCKGLWDFAVWVDRSEHCPPEPPTSNRIEPWMCDYILDNNGTLEHTRRNLSRLMETMVHLAARGNSWRHNPNGDTANG